jgi:hypothetical protein
MTALFICMVILLGSFAQAKTLNCQPEGGLKATINLKSKQVQFEFQNMLLPIMKIHDEDTITYTSHPPVTETTLLLNDNRTLVITVAMTVDNKVKSIRARLLNTDSSVRETYPTCTEVQ